jgi:hypothetical protein
MKRLIKLQINSERLMKNEELMTLRGGYGQVACGCKKDGTTLCTADATVDNCDVGYGSCIQWCNYYCPDYEYAICVGS